jgi:hypothetical protein
LCRGHGPAAKLGAIQFIVTEKFPVVHVSSPAMVFWSSGQAKMDFVEMRPRDYLSNFQK